LDFVVAFLAISFDWRLLFSLFWIFILAVVKELMLLTWHYQAIFGLFEVFFLNSYRSSSFSYLQLPTYRQRYLSHLKLAR
jgi:hypothetical protein